jgi:hypothetical protein
MKSRSLAMFLAVTLAGCGPRTGGTVNSQQGPLALVVADKPIQVQAGEKIFVQVVAVGRDSDSAVISSPDLPPFATLDGSLLTIAPDRSFQGDYSITIVARTKGDSASAVLHVLVARFNTAPTVRSSPYMFLLIDKNGVRGPGCPGSFCTLGEQAGIAVDVCDAERDAVTVELEVVPKGQPFSGVASYSATSAVGVTNCVGLNVLMPGLAPEQTYAFGLRVRDALGAIATWGGSLEGDDGWVRDPWWYFEQGPCIHSTCACLPSDGLSNGPTKCWQDVECCSGKCVPQIWQCQ